MIHRPLHMTETMFSVRMQYTKLEMLQVSKYDISLVQSSLLSGLLKNEEISEDRCCKAFFICIAWGSLAGWLKGYWHLENWKKLSNHCRQFECNIRISIIRTTLGKQLNDCCGWWVIREAFILWVDCGWYLSWRGTIDQVLGFMTTKSACKQGRHV